MCTVLLPPADNPIAVKYIIYIFWRDSPQWAMASFTRFLDHSQWCTTVGRTPVAEWLARRRDLYLTTHNPHNRRTSMAPVGFKPTISAGDRPKAYAFDRATAWIGFCPCPSMHFCRHQLYRILVISSVNKWTLPSVGDNRLLGCDFM